ncbi:hypothetical protein Pint_21652 [Pistacia integerrima]|uniref:Uncharacterized protein n=1 Tax=Pistacia integerrima TaxID=434235 RepID=A0ACC0XFK8_9ROSI|nr:hypothetical protein Pint_21652 [Pistacia integerrima]
MDPGSGNSNHESTEVPIDINQQEHNLERCEQNIQWLPSLHLLTDRNPRKEELRLDLLNAAIEGNIDAVKSLLNNSLLSDSSSSSLSASSSSSSASTPSPFNVAITEKHETIFHVAAGANQTDFVEKMIGEIAPDDLKLQNVKENTAFCLAVMAGNKSIAEKMLNKDPDLLTIRGGSNLTPLNLAAMFGEREMASYLYWEYYRGTLTLADKKQLFFDSIDTSLYDLARELLEDEDEDANENELAMTEYEHGMDRLTPLHRLALTPFHLLDQNNRNDDERTIFHIAIMYRHDDLFKLINQIDPRPLSTVQGAALEMQRELRMFKDVEKLVMPSFRGLKNSEGKTPRELFTSTHAGLQKDGEKWMRNTASQFMLVATIIATVVFQAAFTVPGGVNDAGGNNNLEGTPTHQVVDRTINAIHIYSNHDVSLHFKLLPGL